MEKAAQLSLSPVTHHPTCLKKTIKKTHILCAFSPFPTNILSFPLAYQPCKQLKQIVEYVSRAFHNSQQQQQQIVMCFVFGGLNAKLVGFAIVMCFVFGGLNAKLVSLQNPTTYMNTPTPPRLIGA